MEFEPQQDETCVVFLRRSVVTANAAEAVANEIFTGCGGGVAGVYADNI